MNKRKAQFIIGKDQEDEECLPDVGPINTPEEIQERKILKIKGPKISQVQAKITITAPKPTFDVLDEVQKEEPKTQQNFQPLNIFKPEKLFLHTQPIMLQPPKSAKNTGLTSPTIFFTTKKKENLSPVPETDEYRLFKNKLKWVKIDEKEHLNIELEVFKSTDEHTIQLETLIKGKIVNNKINKKDNVVALECENKNEIHQISFEFEDAKDYDLFNL